MDKVQETTFTDYKSALLQLLCELAKVVRKGLNIYLVNVRTEKWLACHT
jgi:hypothetical protein